MKIIYNKKYKNIFDNSWRLGEVQIAYRIPEPRGAQLNKSSDVVEYIATKFDSTTIGHVEQFIVLALNRNNYPIGYKILSIGGLNATVVDIRVAIQFLLLVNAQSCIIVHNHPSYNTKPSNEDVKVAKKFKDAMNLVDIKLLDSIIIPPNPIEYINSQKFINYYSTADEGQI